MTKINNDGQLEWTFEELDFVGAEQEVVKKMSQVHSLMLHFENENDLDVAAALQKQLNKLVKVRLNLLRLIDGKSIISNWRF